MCGRCAGLSVTLFFISDLPQVHDWPYLGLLSLTRIYDYDVVLLNEGVADWDWQVNLCSETFLPCSLTVVGDSVASGSIRRHLDSRITCEASSGCTAVSLKHVTMACNDNDISASAVLQLSGDGAEALIMNSTFVNCSSAEDGGSVRVFGGAFLTVTGSSFVSSLSLGKGGAVAVVGATAYIADCSFKDSRALNGLGGAVHVQGWVWYPAPVRPSMLHLLSCRFSGNVAQEGGSLAVTASSRAIISDCYFDRNIATQSGGAASMSGPAQITISSSIFVENVATQSGGAASMSGSAQITISASIFVENTALGLGGGALYASKTELELWMNEFHGNSAPGGGGGSLLWEGKGTHCRDDNVSDLTLPCIQNLLPGISIIIFAHIPGCRSCRGPHRIYDTLVCD